MRHHPLSKYCGAEHREQHARIAQRLVNRGLDLHPRPDGSLIEEDALARDVGLEGEEIDQQGMQHVTDPLLRSADARYS